MSNRVLVLALIGIGVLPAPAHAQLSDSSHWGIGASFTPQWESVESLRKLYIEGAGELEGKEFTIGLVRGSARGGDWGVSFVHKPFTDGTTVVNRDDFTSDPCTSQFCSTGSFTQTEIMRDVKLTGVEFHWFRPFATIANRVQIGLNLAGGVARVKGTVESTFEDENVTTVNGQVFRTSGSQTDFIPAQDVLRSLWGIGKVEAQVAIIAAAAFKIKASVGMNIPAQVSFRVGGVVLFGGN